MARVKLPPAPASWPWQARLRRIGFVLSLVTRWIRRDLLIVNVIGRGMEPTLRDGDRLLCARTILPWQGAIVVHPSQPTQQQRYVIGRLVAFAGERRGDMLIRPGFCWVENDNPALSPEWIAGALKHAELDGVGIARLRGRQVYRLPLPRHRRAPLPHLLAEWWRDRQRGVQTRGTIASASLGFSPAVVHSYQATPWDLVRRAFDALQIADSDVLLDYGCGKGRVLVEAIRYPFKRIVGIEIAPELAEQTRQNVRSDRRCRVEIGDARDFQVPDDVTIVYFFNPFDEATHTLVGRNLCDSLRRRSRPLRVITYHTACLPWLTTATATNIGPDLLLYELAQPPA